MEIRVRSLNGKQRNVFNLEFEPAFFLSRIKFIVLTISCNNYIITGSKELESSIEWLKKKSEEENLENVHSEYFKAPHWVR
ncbi:hypothetical protein Avbf_13306 [Armadillidium vulgare]|nr:hypothetical protein Avbf_13306 [Armadillidium vulgare]